MLNSLPDAIILPWYRKQGNLKRREIQAPLETKILNSVLNIDTLMLKYF